MQGILRWEIEDCWNWKLVLLGLVWFCCALTSHSATFQLHVYSDKTVVKFPNFDLLLGTQHHGHLGVLSMPNLPRNWHRDVRIQCMYLTSLPSEGPHAVSMPGIESGYPAPQSSSPRASKLVADLGKMCHEVKIQTKPLQS